MELKWFYELTPEERKSYPPENIIFAYDRLYDEYWSFGGKLDKFGDLKEPRIKDKSERKRD